MKKLFGGILVFGLALAGCSKDDGVTQVLPVTDAEALKSQASSVDSIADFSASDETTIDDQGLRDDSYDAESGPAADYIRGTATVALDSLKPLRWGRHILSVTRNYQTVLSGDTLGLVTIMKTITGELVVAYGQRTPDTLIVDTVVHKPFTEQITRKVLFARIARTDDPHRNWVPVAVTMVQGKTTGGNLFTIASIELSDTTFHYDSTFTDPLTTWFRLGRFHGSVPVWSVRDSVTLRLTVTSTDTAAEYAYLRSGIGADREHRQFGRARMPLVSQTNSGEVYTRVYEKSFTARLPLWFSFLGRFNAVADVVSKGTLADPAAPATNEFWGSPYVVIR